MAIKQAAVAAGISYAIEYAAGYNPTILRSAIAGACGAADYMTKTDLVSKLPVIPVPKDLIGAAAGGLLYGTINSYTETSSLTSGFLRGAFYAYSSDKLLSYISPSFGGEKLFKTLAAVVNQNKKVEETPPSETKPPSL